MQPLLLMRLYPYTTLFRSGAKQAMDELASEKMEENPCYQYAALRNILYENGKAIELLISYEPHFHIICYEGQQDRKSTRLNSSHVAISYAVFCLKNKTKKT